jgi:hypothetical protein
MMEGDKQNDGREGKTGLFLSWVPVEGGGHKERVNEGEYGGCVCIHGGRRRMKPVEIVLRRGGEGRRESDGEVNLTKIHCKHICKYHNVSPV